MNPPEGYTVQKACASCTYYDGGMFGPHACHRYPLKKIKWKRDTLYYPNVAPNGICPQYKDYSE
jgi:hypothetical protein